MVIMVVQPSIPMGFYFKSPVRDYKKGDTILFRIDDEYQKFFKEDKVKLNYIAKKIVATHGDKVEIKNKRIFVNGEDYGEILDIKIATPKIKIDRDCYFLLSKQKNSFDSRYYGQVCKKQIKNKLHLLWRY